MEKPTYLAEAPSFDDVMTHHKYIQCAMIGDAGVGKTTLLASLGERKGEEDCVEDSLSVFGRYDAQITTRTGEPVFVSYTECNSADKHSRLRSLTYRNKQIIFICYSTTNRSSFENAILQWFPEVNMIAPYSPVYIIGTKADIRDEIIATRTAGALPKSVVSQNEGNKLCEQMGAIQYIETTVSNLSSLQKVIKQIGEAMLRQYKSELPEASWKQIMPLHRTCMSPKEKHQKQVKRERRKKKESVAVLLTSRNTPIKKKLTKPQFRQSTLPISYNDIVLEKGDHEIERNEEEKENLEVSHENITKEKKFCLKGFHALLMRMRRQSSIKEQRKTIKIVSWEVKPKEKR